MFFVIREAFHEEEADAILSIPPSSHAAVDAICWHYKKRGSYSVKSGYWLSMQSDDSATSSSTSSASGLGWWKQIWELHLPPKIKFFIWKAVSRWLPSFSVLEACKVPTGSICPLCKAGSETPVHALWSCCKLKLVCQWFIQLEGLLVPGNSTFKDLFDHCQSVIQKSILEELCVTWWRVCYYRNSFVHFLRLLPVSDLVLWSKSFLADFRAAVLLDSKPKPLRMLHWEAPSPSWVKLNSNAAIDLPNKKIDFGVVIRDYESRVIAAMASSLSSMVSVECAEGLAMLEGLKLAVDVGVSHCVVETDAASLVSLVVNKLTPRSDIGLIVSDLLSLSFSFADCSFVFRPRSCNLVAHGLAKFRVMGNSPKVWFEVTPPCVEVLVTSDSTDCS
ncbi:hypothetical protein ACOSQ4_003947 [Xanthoceras sorbifolium]